MLKDNKNSALSKYKVTISWLSCLCGFTHTLNMRSNICCSSRLLIEASPASVNLICCLSFFIFSSFKFSWRASTLVRPPRETYTKMLLFAIFCTRIHNNGSLRHKGFRCLRKLDEQLTDCWKHKLNVQNCELDDVLFSFCFLFMLLRPNCVLAGC